MISRTASQIFLTVSCVILNCASRAGALDGDPELLRVVASAHAANRSAIRTWTGVVQVRDEMHESGELRFTQSAVVKFVYDAQRDALRWNRAVESTRSRAAGDEFKEGGVSPRTGGLLKDGMYTALDESWPNGNREPTIVIHSREAARFGAVSETFNPNYYFGPGGEELSKRFMTFVSAIERGDSAGLRVWREQDVVKVESRFPVGVNSYFADLSRAGNLTEYHASSDGPVKTDYTIHYAERDGIWVPDHIEYSNVNQSVAVTRELRWLENVLNSELADDAFSLESLGVQPGDLIFDSRSKTKSRFKDPSPFANQPAAEHSGPSPGGRKYLLLVIGNALIVVCIVAAILVRRRRMRLSDELPE